MKSPFDFVIEFRLPDGRVLQNSSDGKKTIARFSYDADGFRTIHRPAFLADEKFLAAYRSAMNTGQRVAAPDKLHIEWRVYVACCLAKHASKLGGAFVECGVSTGMTSLAICEYLGFEREGPMFYLIDTFAGIPLSQAIEPERELSASKNQRHYFDSEELVRLNFKRFGNVFIIRGEVPQILTSLPAGEIAYLHIDMNIAYPEVEALKFFWPRMVKGGVILFDDYISPLHLSQRDAIDEVARQMDVLVVPLPTGQGLLIKN